MNFFYSIHQLYNFIVIENAKVSTEALLYKIYILEIFNFELVQKEKSRFDSKVGGQKRQKD